MGRTGSAGRNTSRTSRRESMNIGTFRPDNNVIATPLSLRFGLVYRFSGSELVLKQIWLSRRPSFPLLMLAKL